MRDYALIIDRSGSMAGGRWRDAQAAVEKIAPKVVEADSDGVTMYFFSNTHSVHHNVRTADEVKQLFAREKPGGTTDLGEQLLIVY